MTSSVCGTGTESSQSSSTAAYPVYKGIWLGWELLRFCSLPAHTSLLREIGIKWTLGDPGVWQTELQGWKQELGTSMGRGLMLLRIEPSLLSNSPESRQPLIIKKGRFLSDLHFTPTAGPTQSGPVCEPLQGPEQHWESWRRQQMCADKSHTEGNRLRDFIKDLEQLCCTQGRMTVG